MLRKGSGTIVIDRRLTGKCAGHMGLSVRQELQGQGLAPGPVRCSRSG